MKPPKPPAMPSRYIFATVVTLPMVGCEDPDSLSFAEEEALLDDDLDTDERLVASSDEDGVQILDYVVVSNVSWSGSTEQLPWSDPNDAAWFLNAPNNVSGEVSRVTATIVHDGMLNGSYGLDHIAVLTRGTTLEPSLQYLGFGSGTSTAFFWGESLQPAPPSTLIEYHRGRGPTFWPKGAAPCAPNLQKPCMIFENYSMGGIFGPPVPLTLNAGSFQIQVDTSATNVVVSVWQNGQLKANNVSCLAKTGGNAKCGAQPGDATKGDAVFGFVVNDLVSNRNAGVLNASSKVLQLQPDDCPGPGDCIPY